MYASMENLPCRRNGKYLYIPGSNLPDNITEDELFTEFEDYGIIDINIDEHGANILFETIRGASEASKYLSQDLQQQAMMAGPMMNGGMMGPMGPMGPMGHMGMMGPMGPMGGPMMPMGMMGSGAPMQYGFPSRPVKVHRPHLMKQGPNASIKVTATTDGSRNIISSPEKAASPPEAGNAEDPGIETGQCSLCKKCTSYTCGRCGAFYCSRECQKQSWPSHQTDCNLHMPPLNFAGRRSMTEIEINGCPWQQQRAREHQGRLSPTGKQWRNRNETEGSQERRPPRVSQPGNDAQASGRDERTQSSSFSRSNERAGGNERRFDERPSNRASPGSSYGQEPRDERRGDNQRNFNNRRNDDSNFARGRSNEGSSSYSKPSTNEYNRSPRTAPSNAAASSAMNGSPRTSSSNVENSSAGSPKVAEASSTVATLMKNLKLASPSVKPDPAASEAPKSNGVAAPVAPEVIFEMPGGISIAGGSEVTITHVEETCIYLQARSNLGTLALLTSKLQDHCASAQPLQRNPKKNEFLAAKFPIDGDFYRAIVKKKQSDGFTVNYVDYGNSQAGLSISDMKVLTKDIAEVPCQAVRATLKDVVGGLNKEAMDILSHYFTKEIVLTMEGGEDLTAGVTLFEAGGESVNVKILKAMGKLKSPSPILGMMKAAAAPVAAPVVAAPAPVPVPVVAAPAPVPVPVVAAPAPAPVPVPVVAAPAPVPVPVVAAPAPVPVPVVAAPAPAPVPVPVVTAPAPAPVVAAPVPAPAAPAQNRTFTLEDVTYVPFPPAGSAVTVLINHFHTEHGFFMACPVDIEALERVALLPEQLVALAARTQPFRPASNELCVAKWSDGSWYRAVCLEPAGNDSYNVLFLEYGNSDTVTYPDIRPYSEELVRVPALSSPCFLSEPNPLTDAQRAKVDALFHEGWTEEATVSENVDGSIVLNIPGIKNAL